LTGWLGALSCMVNIHDARYLHKYRKLDPFLARYKITSEFMET